MLAAFNIKVFGAGVSLIDAMALSYLYSALWLSLLILYSAAFYWQGLFMTGETVWNDLSWHGFYGVRDGDDGAVAAGECDFVMVLRL